MSEGNIPAKGRLPDPVAGLAGKAPNLAPPLARRMGRMTTSAVREILKVAEQPDVLSFAGGLPAPELFPVDAIAQAHADVFAREGRAALQYSVTEGWAPLRDWIAGRLGGRGIRASVEDTLITSGSQQGIDLIARALIDPGDVVVVENPSYLAALQTFGGFEAQFAVVGSDDCGLRVNELEAVCKERPVRMVYVVPDFHNPKGTTLSLERRVALVDLARRYRFLIVEDDPYGELRFSGDRLPSLAAIDGSHDFLPGGGKGGQTQMVVQLGTFSKTLAPGLRLGWIHGPESIIRGITVAKQAADLHTATLAQRAVARLLETFDYEDHLARLRVAYGRRCQTMLGALERYFPDGTRWTRPEGGMFIWVQLPGGLRSDDLFAPALAERVAFVPGSAFFAVEKRHEFLRLNYSNRAPEMIEEGMLRLGRVTARAASNPSA
jgi:2-aminoadipate transaminase